MAKNFGGSSSTFLAHSASSPCEKATLFAELDSSCSSELCRSIEQRHLCSVCDHISVKRGATGRGMKILHLETSETIATYRTTLTRL